MRRMKERDKHDKLAKRLGMILTRLNTGEKLSLDELCREFGVSERTLQRDFNERLNYLPIERRNSYYYLDPKVLGRQSNNEISLILMNMGLDTLFSGKHYLSNGVLNNKRVPPFLFMNPLIEDISRNALVFEKLIESVQLKNVVAFSCDSFFYDRVHPYRLVNDRGIWYLTGTHKNHLHLFRVTNISELIRFEDKYQPDTNVIDSLTSKKLRGWIDKPVEVVLQMNANLLKSLMIGNESSALSVLKELPNGDVLTSYHGSNIKTLLRTLKSWIPEVDILSPSWVKYELQRELKAYLDANNIL